MNNSVYRKFGTKRIAGSKGTALVELALMMPLIMLLAIGLIEFSQAYMQLNNLNKSIRDGISYLSRLAVNETNNGIIDFTSGNASQIVSDTKDLIQENFHATALPSVNLADSDIQFAAEGVDHIRVTVTYCHPLLMGALFSTLTGFFGATIEFANCPQDNQIPFNVTGVYRVL